MTTEQNTEDKAWRLRESGSPVEAIGLLIPLGHKYEVQGNWAKAIDICFEMSIAWKIHGRDTDNPLFYDTALEVLNYARELALENNIILRVDWFTYVGEVQVAKADFNGAIESFTKYLELATPTPEEQANVNAQLGFAYARFSEEEKGIKMLRESIGVLSNLSTDFVHQGKDVHAIWLTGAMLKLAQVINDKEEAKRLLYDALVIAHREGLGAREHQIENLLDRI